jgi:hypothetical protein
MSQSDTTLPVWQRALGTSLPLWHTLDPDAAGASRTTNYANQRLEALQVTTASGRPLRAEVGVARTLHYDVAILQHGRMDFRLKTDHDWFNLLSWLTWPRAKAALNLRHVLHYRLLLLQRTGSLDSADKGERIARDGWMQRLAGLDEGGCIVTPSLLDHFTHRGDWGLYHWHSSPTPEQLDRNLRWFGHAAIEHLRHSPSPLRLWVTTLETLDDTALMHRVLTFSPELQPDITRVLDGLAPILPSFVDAIHFDPDDPFRGGSGSIMAPW